MAHLLNLLGVPGLLLLINTINALPTDFLALNSISTLKRGTQTVQRLQRS